MASDMINLFVQVMGADKTYKRKINNKKCSISIICNIEKYLKNRIVLIKTWICYKFKKKKRWF